MTASQSIFRILRTKRVIWTTGIRILFYPESWKGSRNKIERLMKRKRMRQRYMKSCTLSNHFRHTSPSNANPSGSIHALIRVVNQKTSSLRRLVSQNISISAKTLWSNAKHVSNLLRWETSPKSTLPGNAWFICSPFSKDRWESSSFDSLHELGHEWILRDLHSLERWV